MTEQPHLQATNAEGQHRMSSMSLVSLHSFFASGSRLKLPSSKKPNISILLALFNRAELTLACLRSLSEDYKQQLEIIIVDNNSADETPKLLDRLEGVKILRNTRNENFLFAANQAAAQARGKYLLFLNNDTEVFPGTITSALNTIEENKDIGAVGAKLISPDGTLQEAGGILWQDGSCLGYGRDEDPFAPQYMFQRNVDYCSGAFLLTHRKIFEEMGGFDEAFRPAYYEDTDYCIRLWKRGKRVVYDPNAIVLHHEFGSAPEGKDAINLQRIHRKVFAEKHKDHLEGHLRRSEANIIQARSHNHDQSRILYIDDRAPHPALGSGYPRSHTILKRLHARGYFVTLYPLGTLDEDWTSIYTDMPGDLEVFSGAGQANLETFLKDRQGYYDTIIISRPHNMRAMNPVIRAHPDWFRRTVVLYDAEALSTERELLRRKLRGETISQTEHQTILGNELQLASFADSVICVSEKEKTAFVDHGMERVFELGHVLSTSSPSDDFDNRSGILFVGAIYGDMTSNADAVLWFVKEVFPRIRKVLGSNVVLSVVGHNESDQVRSLASNQILILGAVDDLSKHYEQNRIFIAPTRFAAGIPHKIHEAAAHGIPVVATPILADQLKWQSGEELAVGENAEEFASSCIELYQDSNKWSRMQTAAIQAVRSDCSNKVFEARLDQILTSREKRQMVVEPILEWTGERFLPWIDEPIVAYEHLHRYAYAAQFVAGKRVLDLGSGEGYGSNILASKASSVVGVDSDEASIRHANTKYGALNLSFLLGSITDVAIHEEHTFDVIVCFETIEHLSNHGAILEAIDKLLAKNGLLIISTPNSKTYTEDNEQPNPFHEKELSFDEFRELLNRHYSHTYYLGQRALPSSSIWAIGTEVSEWKTEFFVERNSAEFSLVKGDGRNPMYIIALASNVPQEARLQDSVLLDNSNQLAKQTTKHTTKIREENEKRETILNEKLSQSENSIANLDGQIKELDQEIHIRDQEIHIRKEELVVRKEELVVARDRISQHESALSAHETRFQEFETEIRSELEGQKQAHIGLMEERDKLDGELFVIKSSRGWRIVEKFRGLIDAVFPPHTHRRNFIEYWRRNIR